MLILQLDCCILAALGTTTVDIQRFAHGPAAAPAEIWCATSEACGTFAKSSIFGVGVFWSPKQVSDRLSTGAIVKELILEGDRLCFELSTGAGPATGWVSIVLKEKVLCQRTSSDDWTLVETPAPLWQPSARGDRKPRIVCLHGTACCEKIFKMQLAKLLPKAQGKLDLVFLEGRTKIEAGPAFDTMQKFFPGCPNFMYDKVALDSKGWRIYDDPQGALGWLQQRLKELAPFDGLLGFSQGANFSLMLAAQAACGLGLPVGFAVLLCPNAPGFVEQVPELFAGGPLPMPILVVSGEQEGYGAGMEPVFEAALKQGLELDTKGEDAAAAHVVKLLARPEVLVHKVVDRIVSFILASC